MERYSLDNFIGNVYNRNLMKRQLENETFSPFTILEGVYGTGKSTTAKTVAMRLTCESPIGADPCCVCQTCRNNMKAFKTTGESSTVKVINLGRLENKSEVNDLIKSVFDLKSSNKASVYVFEEVHVLKNLKGAQTAFLAEIDKMPPNVYVLMCTTRGYDVIPELANRAIRYKFNRLTDAESHELLDSLVGDQISIQLKNLIVRYAKGIPRSIENSASFVLKNGVSEEEYREFIQDVSEESICTVFSTMSNSNSMNDFIATCNNFVEGKETRTLYVAIKEFLINAVFHCSGANCQFSAYTRDILNSMFTEKLLEKALMVVNSYNENLTTADLLFMLFKIRLCIQERSAKDVFAESSAVAAKSNAQVRVAKQTEKYSASVSEHVLSPVNVQKLTGFKE